jgi:molecular chaperone DnaJ
MCGKSDDYYNELGISRGSTQPEIKAAYFKLAKKYHPDVNSTAQAKERFSHINNAYETLSDDNKRAVYDQTGMTGDEQAQDPFNG